MAITICVLNTYKEGDSIGSLFKLDSNGNQFEFPPWVLDANEYAKIISEINSNYEIYKGQLIAAHYSLGIDGIYYIYYFENHGFNDYNIFEKSEF